MNRMIKVRVRLYLTLAVVLLVIPVALGAGTEPKTAAKEPPTSHKVSALQAEIQELVKVEKSELGILYDEFRNAKNHDTALDIQLQIQELKMTTKINLFRVQAKHARQQGDSKRALEIDKIIETLVVEGSHGKPIDR